MLNQVQHDKKRVKYRKEGEKMQIILAKGAAIAIGGMVPALAIGLIGFKAMEAIGRNPESSGKILPAMLIGMALAEAIAIYALILAFTG